MGKKFKFASIMVLVVVFILLFMMKASSDVHADEVDCTMIYKIYGHAISHGKEKEFLDLAEAYYECAIVSAEMTPDTDEVMAYLRAKNQAGDGVRTESYNGELKAHPLVVKAGFALVKGLAPYSRIPYVSSLVRTASHQKKLLQHPILKSQATKRSMHVLGGLAVDVAFIGRKISMQDMGKHARSVLTSALGKEQANLLNIIIEPYCLHIELNKKNPVSARMIEKRKEKLVRLNILGSNQAGVVPHVNDYVTEKKWLASRKTNNGMVRR